MGVSQKLPPSGAESGRGRVWTRGQSQGLWSQRQGPPHHRGRQDAQTSVQSNLHFHFMS